MTDYANNEHRRDNRRARVNEKTRSGCIKGNKLFNRHTAQELEGKYNASKNRANAPPAPPSPYLAVFRVGDIMDFRDMPGIFRQEPPIENAQTRHEISVSL